ncbi:MAG TPA: hypothetical protein VG796_04295 [Verrucomicrobiales bacterium]|nr:hypothetical protein [Verrucomicrobiales bacterium]
MKKPPSLHRAALRLFAGSLTVLVAGCALTSREQDGDVDPENKLGDYVAIVTPTKASIAPASAGDATASVSFTVTGECTGIHNPIDCFSFQPDWHGFEVRGGSNAISVSLLDKYARSSPGTITVDLPKMYKWLLLPNALEGNTGHREVSIVPSAPLPEELDFQPGIISLTITHPGGPPPRKEADANTAALAAPGNLVLKPATGATSILIPCPVIYTGPSTRLNIGEFSGPDAAHFSGGVIPRDIGGDHGNSEDGFVTFTLPPAPGAFAYSATLTITTENGASCKVELKGLRP